MCDTDEDEEEYVPPSRKWMWLSLVAELSKVPVGITMSMCVIADTLHSVTSNLHEEAIGHWNFVRGQQVFRDQIVHDLERIPEA